MRNEIGIEVGAPFYLNPLRPLPVVAKWGDTGALTNWTSEEFRKELAGVYWRVVTRTMHDGGGTGMHSELRVTYAEAWVAKVLLGCGPIPEGMWWSLSFEDRVTGTYPGVEVLRVLAKQTEEATQHFFDEGAYAAAKAAEKNIAKCVKHLVKGVMEDETNRK